MEKMKVIWLVFGMVFGFCFYARAQESATPKNPGDSYPKADVSEHTPLAYPPLREADVAYCKRIERVIDTREKKNEVMNWPKNPLYNIIHNLVTNGEADFPGELKVYRNDSLTNPMSIKNIAKIGAITETVSKIKDTTDIYNTVDVLVNTPYDYSEIKRWQIVEDWIFDKQRSEFFPRIVAIAPLYNPAPNGVPLPEQPMFYISWEQVRPFLAKEEIFNPENDVRMSYLDFFDQRLFTSHITKENNSQDLAIKDQPEYKDSPMQALYESERIKEELMNKEDDLWEH